MTTTWKLRSAHWEFFCHLVKILAACHYRAPPHVRSRTTINTRRLSECVSGCKWQQLITAHLGFLAPCDWDELLLWFVVNAFLLDVDDDDDDNLWTNTHTLLTVMHHCWYTWCEIGDLFHNNDPTSQVHHTLSGSDPPYRRWLAEWLVKTSVCHHSSTMSQIRPDILPPSYWTSGLCYVSSL